MLRAALTLVLLLQTTVILRAAEITFFCTDALAPSMHILVPQFEEITGHRVKIIVANAGTIASMLENGETADLAVILPPAWERLRVAGRIDPNVRTELGRVGLGLFVKRGGPRPDISTVATFKRTMMSAQSVAVRDPQQRSPVGTYLIGLFERLQLSDAMKPKLRLTTRPPYAEVRNGEAEFGFSTLAEIASEPDVELVGPLPPAIQTYNVFLSAIPVGSDHRAVTGELLRFIGGNTAKELIRSSGIEID
jgi:molybdate transport system substrate-binding protein